MAPSRTCECGACRKCKHREYMRRYYAQNREKYLEGIRLRRAENPEPARARNRKWAREHAAEAVERKAIWRKANPERVAEYQRTYRQRHPDKMIDQYAKRRARKAGVFVAEVDRLEIFRRDGGRCHICGRLCSAKNFHLDHLVPIALGGDHSPDNVAVAHPRCNQRRGAGRTDAQLLLASF